MACRRSRRCDRTSRKSAKRPIAPARSRASSWRSAASRCWRCACSTSTSWSPTWTRCCGGYGPSVASKYAGWGCGLGLGCVYGRARQSGGYVWCYSERGEGTTFKVYLPRVDAPVDQFPARAALPRTLGSETILLVEDEVGLRALTRRLLEKHGYMVLEAGTAEAALALAGQHVRPIHLLLADVVLPGASGPTLGIGRAHV